MDASVTASIRQARQLAWIGTVITVLLAVVPEVVALFGGPRAAYAPDIAILAATLVVLVWYTYWTFRVVVAPSVENERQRKRAAEALSTALLAELQWIDRGLRDIYDCGVWDYDPLTHPLLDSAQGKVEVFQSSTISRIATLRSRLADVRGAHQPFIKQSHRMPLLLEQDPDMERRFHLVRLKAYLATRAVVELVGELEQEGGAKPPPRAGIEAAKRSLPPLPTSPFPQPMYQRHDPDTLSPRASERDVEADEARHL